MHFVLGPGVSDNRTKRHRDLKEQLANQRNRIINSSILVSLVTFAVSIFTSLKDLFIAYHFGVSADVDALLMAFVIPTVVVAIVAGSIQNTITPVYLRLKQDQGLERAEALLHNVVMLSTLGLAVAAIVIALMSHQIMDIIASNFSAERKENTRELLLLLIPVIFISNVSKIWIAVLNAERVFLVPASIPILSPIAVMAGILALSDSMGINAIIYSAQLGAVLELAFCIWLVKHYQIQVWPKHFSMDPEIKNFIRNLSPLLIGSVLMSSTTLVDQSMAAMLPAGSVSVLNYGNKVTALVTGVMAVGISTVALPYFSRYAINRQWHEMITNTRKLVMLILTVTIPVTLGLIVFSDQIIWLLFERGEFTAENTSNVSQVQVFALLQIPFFVAGVMGAKLLSSINRNNMLFIFAAINLAINIAGNYLFMNLYGVRGISLSTSLVYLIAFFEMYGFFFYYVYKQREIESSPETPVNSNSVSS